MRQLISSGHPWESRIGYSRAVRAGDRVWVSGTVANMADGSDPPDDVYLQARRALEIVVAALEEAGASAADVVRTRIFVTRPESIEDAGRAHAEVFGEARPATTALVVELPDPRWLVEFEAEAVVGD